MKKEKGSPVVFLIQSALLWSCVPIVYSFMPVYLEYSGFGEVQTGLLLALGPIMSIVLQPFMGIIADRSKYKNIPLIVLNAGTMVSILLFTLGNGRLYIIFASFLLAFFQAALISVSETVTLEGLESINKPYGPVRLAGTAGYASVSVLVGFFLEKNIRSFFYITAAVAFLSILSSFSLPKVEGHQSKNSRIAATDIFSDKLLILFLSFATVAHMSIAFYQNFFPVYFANIGGTSDILGVLYAVAAVSEAPFLIYADKIEKKLGIEKTLAFSMGVVFIRYILMYFIKSPILMYPLMLLNGLTYIVFVFTMAVYINRTVAPQLRATGQTIHGSCTAIGRILGSVLGGWLIGQLGILNAILCFAILSAVSIAVFVAVLHITVRKQGA